MAARRPFWKWQRWKSIGFCLWPPSTCIWNLKLKFQSKLDLCSGNHVVYRQTDGRTDGQTHGRTWWIQYTPPSNFVERGYNKIGTKQKSLKMIYWKSMVSHGSPYWSSRKTKALKQTYISPHGQWSMVWPIKQGADIKIPKWKWKETYQNDELANLQMMQFCKWYILQYLAIQMLHSIKIWIKPIKKICNRICIM